MPYNADATEAYFQTLKEAKLFARKHGGGAIDRRGVVFVVILTSAGIALARTANRTANLISQTTYAWANTIKAATDYHSTLTIPTYPHQPTFTPANRTEIESPDERAARLQARREIQQIIEDGRRHDGTHA